MLHREVLGGHQWLCWLFCAGLLLQKAPGAPCGAVGTWDNQLLSFSLSRVLKNLD